MAKEKNNGNQSCKFLFFITILVPWVQNANFPNKVE